MKKIFLILLLAGCTVFAKATKLALIGDEKDCSLLMVELSKDDKIQLLERAEIDKVLKEHKLSKSALAASRLVKLFPHVDIFAIIRRKRLVAFNAKNGFRLMDANALKVQELAKLIRLAVKKLSIQNPVYVSIVSVRDVGVPRRYKAKIKELTRLLEQELMKQGNIQMLERSHLALVNKERELTEKRYNLKSSARLLTLEFEPGSEAHIVNVKVLIRNLGNKIIGTVKIPDGFKNTIQSSTSLSKKIFIALTKPRIVSIEAKREAQRFFKEYQRLVKSQGSGQPGEIKKFRAAKDKLFSALALAPNNRKIRFAELIYYSKMLRALPLEKKIPAIRKQLQRAKKFRADFGICRPSVFEPNIICGEILTNHAARWTPEFQKQYIRICHEFRPLLITDIKTLYYPYDLADGINSLKELKNLWNVVISSNWPQNYGSQREWLKQRLADYTLLYKEAAKYIAAHPQQTKKVNHAIWECYLTDIFYPNQRSLDLSCLAEHLEQTKELCKFVAESKLDSIKPPIYLLDAMRSAISNRTKTHFSRVIDDYYKRLASFKPELLRPRQHSRARSFKNSSLYYRFRDFCRIIIKQDDLPDQRLKAYQQKHQMNSEFEDLERLVMMSLCARSQDAFSQLTKKVKLMKKFTLQYLKSNNFGNGYGSIIEYVFANDGKGKSIASEKMKFFFDLNSNFEIDTRPYRKLWSMAYFRSPSRLRGAAENSGEIALFFEDKRLLIRQKDGAFIEISSPSGTLLIPQKEPHSEWKRPIALSNSHLVFVDTKLNMHIYDRATKKWHVCKDFSPESVRSLLIHRGRIYALAGGEEWSVQNQRNYMFSCRLDGTGRKILFSSERDEKLNELDKLRGGLSGLMSMSENKLVFMLSYTNNYTHVWEYDIEQNRFKRLFKTPYSGTNCDALWKGLDKALYLSSCSWSDRLYRFKPDKYKAEWIFCQSGCRRKFDSADAAPAFFNSRGLMRPPWRVSKNFFWSGGGRSALLDLNNIKATPPLLLLPRARHLYELDDNRMIFLGDYRYFIVRFIGKKEKSANE